MNSKRLILNIRNSQQHSEGPVAYFRERCDRLYKNTGRLLSSFNYEDVEVRNNICIITISDRNSKVAKTLSEERINIIRSEEWAKLAHGFTRLF